MTLVVIHYHLRPGGIRRIIELAMPHLVSESSNRISRILLATGEAADRRWHSHLERQLSGIPIEVLVEPTFKYLSEQRHAPKRTSARIRRVLETILTKEEADPKLVWAHNLGVGRNLLLTRELAAVCEARQITLIAHHHDWWFDNRWTRWTEMRRFGARNIEAAAQWVFSPQRHLLHVAINHADATILSRHFGKLSLWLPNLTTPETLPSASKNLAARRWLNQQLDRSAVAADSAQRGQVSTRQPSSSNAPVWLLPCRTLRRKNIAEALLLTRWLRPEAWLVVTGSASSADEEPYFEALQNAARLHHWRLQLGVLSGDETGKPAVSELMAASETVLLTSIQEGFGLPYLEAAAAHRPLVARRLPNIAPDLARFGFRFQQAYDEILIAPELFDWKSERARQQKLFRCWRSTMPEFARRLVIEPAILASTCSQPIAYSRLTLAAQLEILAQPVEESWTACLALNPFLEIWQKRAAAGALRPTPWPQSANRWLNGKAYARRLFSAVSSLASNHTSASAANQVQADFIAAKLDTQYLYPLLWSKDQ